jgi:hypothetical protein
MAMASEIPNSRLRLAQARGSWLIGRTLVHRPSLRCAAARVKTREIFRSIRCSDGHVGSGILEMLGNSTLCRIWQLKGRFPVRSDAVMAVLDRAFSKCLETQRYAVSGN